MSYHRYSRQCTVCTVTNEAPFERAQTTEEELASIIRNSSLSPLCGGVFFSTVATFVTKNVTVHGATAAFVCGAAATGAGACVVIGRLRLPASDWQLRASGAIL